MMNANRTGSGTQAARERGSALVLVLIFSIGALLLVSTLLAFATEGVRDTRERHDQTTLRKVLLTGVAHSLFEVNKNRLSGTPYDPDGDGPGALTLGADGQPGVLVTAPSGRALGRFRTTIRPDGSGRMILTVVAAQPSLAAPRRLLAARVLIDPGVPPFLNDRQALSIIGPSEALDLRIGNGASLSITDPALSVPAVNVTDPEVHAAFVAAAGGATIVGADPANPGSSATGAGSITNDPAGTVDEKSVDGILSGIQQFVTDSLPTATDLAEAAEAAGATVTVSGGKVSIESGGSSATLVLPPGVYLADAVDVTTGVTIRGSGTLIVGDRLDLLNGSNFDWSGEVLVIGSDQARLIIQGGGRVDVAGTLAVVSSEGKEATLEARSGSRLNVSGALLALGAGAEGESEFELDSGSEVDVDGILLLLGDEVEFETNPSAALTVDGSMIVAVPEDTAEGEIDLEFDNGSNTQLTFDNSEFESALSTLKAFFDLTNTDDLFPVRAAAYWEGAAPTLLAEQQADLDAYAADPVLSPIGMSK